VRSASPRSTGVRADRSAALLAESIDVADEALVRAASPRSTGDLDERSAARLALSIDVCDEPEELDVDEFRLDCELLEDPDAPPTADVMTGVLSLQLRIIPAGPGSCL
jgi:hypothetical protein